jgi:hypothetical protein
MDSLTNAMDRLCKGTVIELNTPDYTYHMVIPRKRFYKRPVITHSPPIDEVELGVREWYAALGQKVPEADLAFMAAMKKAEAQEEIKAEPVVEIDEMPPHGTPAFWAWCRRRKAAKDAQRAAAGLPPLPTAAEKAKLKAAKLAK